MHQILGVLLFHFLITPLDRATFPSSYEYFHGTELEYRVDYRWEESGAVSVTRRSATDGKETRSFLLLDRDFKVIADSALGPDGNPTWVGRYEFQGGRPVAYRTSSQVTGFHYSGDNLDSVAVEQGDSLIEYYTYRYDSRDQLVQSDHFYDKGGLGRLGDNRRMVAYFLPDSIVVNQAFVPANGDSARKVIYLSDGLPVKMVEREYHSSSSAVNTHIWAFETQSSIARGGGGRDASEGFENMRPVVFDLLGRQIGSVMQMRRSGWREIGWKPKTASTNRRGAMPNP